MTIFEDSSWITYSKQFKEHPDSQYWWEESRKVFSNTWEDKKLTMHRERQN
jgi:hypothetical protein